MAKTKGNILLSAAIASFVIILLLWVVGSFATTTSSMAVPVSANYYEFAKNINVMLAGLTALILLSVPFAAYLLSTTATIIGVLVINFLIGLFSIWFMQEVSKRDFGFMGEILSAVVGIVLINSISGMLSYNLVSGVVI